MIGAAADVGRAQRGGVLVAHVSSCDTNRTLGQLNGLFETVCAVGRAPDDRAIALKRQWTDQAPLITIGLIAVIRGCRLAGLSLIMSSYSLRRVWPRKCRSLVGRFHWNLVLRGLRKRMKVIGDALRFGTRLRSYMDERNLSINDVAAALGVNQSTVRKICSGENVTQYLQLANLAGIVGVTPNDLLGFDTSATELDHLLPAVQGVIEQLGHDRSLARLAAEIAIRAAEEQRILEEDAATEIRVRAKLLLSQAVHPKLPR